MVRLPWGTSDIDFIAVLRNPPSESDFKAVVASHEKVEVEIFNTNIMGSYILEKDLGKPQGQISPLLTYYNKQLNEDGTSADINPITWWILKKHGVRVYGSELSLNYDLDVKSLVSYVIGNLNTYWASWIDRLEQQLPLINLTDQESITKQLDEAVEWCTLGMLRQLYTLREHDIKSKVEAGYYGITTIPQQWHGLIYEAINIKRLCSDRIYSSNERRLTDLVALLRYILLEANQRETPLF
jgi:hypothetical protein